MILCFSVAFAAQPAIAKHKHHAKHAKHAEQAAPASNLELALQAAERKDWNKARNAARTNGDPTLIKLVTWLCLQDADSHATFQEISAFIRANPYWPQQLRLRLRAEQSLRFSDVPDVQLSAWFADFPPASGTGKVKYAELLLRRKAAFANERARVLIRDAWRTGDFEDEEEKRIAAVYHNWLGPEDHVARADYLLWNDHDKAAKRLLDLLPDDKKALMHARLALLEIDRSADFYLAHVPHALLADPGLIYARAEWRVAKGDDAGVRELLLSAPATVPYPEKWWKLRDRYIRQAIGDHDYMLARRLLANHGQINGQELADASWLSGWLMLEFLHDSRSAYMQFYRMYDSVKFATSKARAAYWAARAARVAGDVSAEHGWYLAAASWPSTFYGQLAYAELHPGQELRVPVEPALSDDERARFANIELARAIALCVKAHQPDLATALLHHLVDTAGDAQQIALAGELGRSIGSPLLAVRGAKRAAQRGLVLIRTGYPTVKLPSNLPFEPALALAVVRQESEFDARAKSKTGAVGMMQVLPKTAKEMARKSGMKFSESQLYESTYNIQIGSEYLSRLIKGYDGSYVMAVAAYNAGPGNVRKWTSTLARHDAESMVDWIETIPFYETRNYVERVMENLEVYRALLTSGEHTPLAIKQDLIRGTR